MGSGDLIQGIPDALCHLDQRLAARRSRVKRVPQDRRPLQRIARGDILDKQTLPAPLMDFPQPAFNLPFPPQPFGDDPCRFDGPPQVAAVHGIDLHALQAGGHLTCFPPPVLVQRRIGLALVAPFLIPLRDAVQQQEQACQSSSPARSTAVSGNASAGCDAKPRLFAYSAISTIGGRSCSTISSTSREYAPA